MAAGGVVQAGGSCDESARREQAEEIIDGRFMRPEAALNDLPADRLTPDGRRVLDIFLTNNRPGNNSP